MCDSFPSDLSDASLRRAMPDVVAAEHRSVAMVVAYLAEFERRRLHTADGYPTLYAYAVEALGYSDDAAWRRSKAAEMARDYPVMLPMLADGGLHLTAIVMVAPHLTRANEDELLALVARKGKKAIERVLAERFPKPDLPTYLAPAAHAQAHGESTLCTVAPARRDTRLADETPATEPVTAPAPPAAPPARLTQRAPERFGLQVTIDQTTHDLLRRAQELLSHQVPSGDLAQVLRRVLEAAVPVLVKQRFGAGGRPRRSRSSGSKTRYVPMHVRRAVYARDGGQCTYVSDNGHRCAARKFLELDHVTAFALGGQSTVGNLRLRCRAHNQYEAIRTFGSAFMAERSAKGPESARAGT